MTTILKRIDDMSYEDMYIDFNLYTHGYHMKQLNLLEFFEKEEKLRNLLQGNQPQINIGIDWANSPAYVRAQTMLMFNGHGQLMPMSPKELRYERHGITKQIDFIFTHTLGKKISDGFYHLAKFGKKKKGFKNLHKTSFKKKR